MKLSHSINCSSRREEALINAELRSPGSEFKVSLVTSAATRQRGVALVITLILLAVITTLAIAFLALTHRETGSVDAMSRTTDAELAVDSAVERAKAQLMA